MSYIDVINHSATASAQAKSGGTDKDKDVMGKEDFLTLLVTQLQNQDPLNPDDPTEFTAQLAQFSSLEQLFNLNESMENVASAVSDSQKLSALTMIGKEVAYAESDFKFDGSPVQVGYSIDGEASDITLLLQKDGATVTTLKGSQLQQGDHFMTWDGLTASGAPAPIGEYSIVVEASAAAESIAAAPLIRSVVTGVDLNSVSGGLLFTRAGEVDVNKIKGVYEVGTAPGQQDLAGQETAAADTESSSDTTMAAAEEIAEETVPTEG
jgi:flagellar basal-body rod modification protein FlgD